MNIIVYLSNELKKNCIFSMLNIFDTYFETNIALQILIHQKLLDF
jgi:hypothetical protein